MQPSPPLTGLLQAAQAGDRSAAEQVLRVVYDELKGLAHGIRRRGSETLGTTALVHEAWLKLAATEDLPIESRAHFRHLAARAMRMIVVDEARSRSAQKRGGDQRPVTFDDALDAGTSRDPLAVVAFDEAVQALEAVDARAARVLECRVFGGLDVVETAESLDVSTATVKRDFRFARAFLADHLS